MVTHLHEFVLRLFEENLEGIEFLVAEQKENGDKTFHVTENMFDKRLFACYDIQNECS